MKIVLVNGPPRSGKDTAQSAVDGSIHLKLSQPVKEGAHTSFGLPLDLYPADYFEGSKDMPSDLFFGKTPRQVYISCSEDFVKKISEDTKVFGKILCNKIKNRSWAEDDVFIITDSGFEGEAESIVEEFGRDNVVLIRVHREGFTFEGDSRGYIYLDRLGVESFDVLNRGIEKYKEDIRKIIKGDQEESV